MIVASYSQVGSSVSHQILESVQSQCKIRTQTFDSTNLHWPFTDSNIRLETLVDRLVGVV